MGLDRKQPRTTTRRTFLGWWMAAILTSTVVTVVAPLAVYIFPPRNPNQTKQKIRIALDTQVDALQEGGVSRFQAPAGMAFVMADGGEGNSAMDPNLRSTARSCTDLPPARCHISRGGSDLAPTRSTWTESTSAAEE